jgi:HK97 family phage portal protein
MNEVNDVLANKIIDSLAGTGSAKEEMITEKSTTKSETPKSPKHSYMIPSGFSPDKPEEVFKWQNEQIYKSEISRMRAEAFERRKRLPYLIEKGLSKPGRISFDVLRRAASAVHIVRICINVLKSKVTKTKWAIVPVDSTVNNNSKDPRIEQLTNFFRQPNRNSETFRTFLDKILEDLLVLDAVAIEKTRYPDGELAELHVVDAATIRPVYDEFGNQDIPITIVGADGIKRELPVSYVQVVDNSPYGGRESGTPVAFWPKRDFIYFSLHPQNAMESFGYGLSPIESVIGVVANILNADNFNGTYFESGSFPPMILQFMTSMDQRELQAIREYMKTTLEGEFHRPAILAGEKEIKVINLRDIVQRDMQFMQYMDFMARLLAAAYGLSAQDIGLTNDVNRATSETLKELSESKGYGSILNLLEEQFNMIIWKDFGYTDLKFSWVLLDSIAPETLADIHDIALRNGTMTINEVRKKSGLPPYGSWADIPAVLTNTGQYIPLRSAEDQANDERAAHLQNEIPYKDQAKKEPEDLVNPRAESEFDIIKPTETKEIGGGRMEDALKSRNIIEKSIITRDGKYRCWVDDRGVGQPFIFVNILTGEGYAAKPPIAVNLDSQKLEEYWTNKLYREGYNVNPVKRMTEPDFRKLLPTKEVEKEFTNYQNMTPAFDSEKWKSKYGGSRKFSYYQVSKYIEGRNLRDPLLLEDMKRVPNDYKRAIEDLAKLWLAEKKYVMGDRRADQYIITPDKRAWGFDYQFVGNKSRWQSTKDAIPQALEGIPELKNYFLELTGQKPSSLQQYTTNILNKVKKILK